MDYQNLRADVERFLTRHYSQGRDGHEIDKVVIHHNAGCLSVDDIYNVWQAREASAHYQVTEDGTVGQLVHDWDTAWHAGSWEANSSSIGVEHANCGGPNEGWPISDATVIAGARLVAALCWGYNLGRPEWCVNVFPHQYFSSTACPGQLATTHRDRYMAEAQRFYDELTGGGAPTVSRTEVRAEAPAEPAHGLAVDGVPGPATISALQAALGTPVDGIVSGQYKGNQKYVPASDGLRNWEWLYVGSGPSPMVQELQRRVGAEVDGIIGPRTISRFQERLGVDVDGYWGAATTRVLQEKLNRGEGI